MTLNHHFAQQLHDRDYERYVTTLFSPAQIRPALWVLYTFHNEISDIRSKVKEPMMGMIRLQWWHDAITTLYQGKEQNHALLHAIAEVLKQGVPWQEKDFHALIEGYISVFQTDEGNYEHNLQVQGWPVLKMACDAAGVKFPEEGLIKIAAANACLQEASTQKNADPNVIDGHINELSKIKGKKPGPLLIYYSTSYYLQKIKNHHYQGQTVLRSKMKFMLPLYLFVKDIIN